MKKNPVGWCTFLEQLFWELTNHPTRLIFSLHFLEKENRHLVYSKLQILYNKILMTSPTRILLPLRNRLSSQQADYINGTCYLFFVNVMQHFKSLLLILVGIFKHLNVRTTHPLKTMNSRISFNWLPQMFSSRIYCNLLKII